MTTSFYLFLAIAFAKTFIISFNLLYYPKCKTFYKNNIKVVFKRILLFIKSNELQVEAEKYMKEIAAILYHLELH